MHKQTVSELAQLILHSAQEVARKCDMKLDRRSVSFFTQSAFVVLKVLKKVSCGRNVFSDIFRESSYGLWIMDYGVFLT